MKKLIKRLLTGFLALATMLTAIPMQAVQAAEGPINIKFVIADPRHPEDPASEYTMQYPGINIIDLGWAWTEATEWEYKTPTWYTDDTYETEASSVEISELDYDEGTNTYTLYANEELEQLVSVIGSISAVNGNEDAFNFANQAQFQLDDTMDSIFSRNIHNYAYDAKDFYLNNRNISTGVTGTYKLRDGSMTLREWLVEAHATGLMLFKVDVQDVCPTDKIEIRDVATGLKIMDAVVSNFRTSTIKSILEANEDALEGYDLTQADTVWIEPTMEADISKTFEQWWDTYHVAYVYIGEEVLDPVPENVTAIKFVDKFEAIDDIVVTLDSATPLAEVDFERAFLKGVNFEKIVPYFFTDKDCTAMLQNREELRFEGTTAVVYYIGPAQNITTATVDFMLKGTQETQIFSVTLNKTEVLADYAVENSGAYIFNKEDIKLVDAVTSAETPVGTMTVLQALQASNGNGRVKMIIDAEDVTKGTEFIFKDAATGETIYTATVETPKTTTIDSLLSEHFQDIDGYAIEEIYTSQEVNERGNKNLTVADWFKTYGNVTGYVFEEAHEPHQVTVKFIGGTQESPEQYTWTYQREYGDETVEVERAWRVATQWKKDVPQTFYTNSTKTIPYTGENQNLAEVTPNSYTFYFKGATTVNGGITSNVYVVDGENLTLLGTVTESYSSFLVHDATDKYDYDYYNNNDKIYVIGRKNTDNESKHYLVAFGDYSSMSNLLVNANALEADIYCDIADLHSKNYITVIDGATGKELVKINKTQSSDTISKLLDSKAEELRRYDLENVYTDAVMSATVDNTKTIATWYEAYGHTKVYLKALPRTYEIRVYDVTDGTPTLAGSKVGLNGTGTLDEAIDLAVADATTEFDYVTTVAYSDLRCLTTVNREMTVAEFCGNEDMKAIYFERIPQEEGGGLYQLYAYSVEGGNRQLISSNINLDGETLMADAIAQTLPMGYEYDPEDLFSDINLGSTIDLNGTVADFCGGDKHGEVYISAANISTNFDGMILNVDYANGEIRQAYKPALSDFEFEGSSVVKVNVPETIDVHAIYLPAEIEGCTIPKNEMFYAKNIFATLPGYGWILEEDVKLGMNMSGVGATHIIFEGPVRIGNLTLENFFAGCPQLKWVEGLEYIIGNTTSLDRTFSECPNLEYVSFDAAANNITTPLEMIRTFESCPKLKEVVINGATVTVVNTMFANGENTRATAQAPSPLKKISFTNCDLSGFVSISAFTDAYCEYDFTGSTGIMRADFTDLFLRSYTNATAAQLNNETELKFTGWDGTITSVADWFKESKIMKADFSGLAGLKNTVDATGAFESATITSDVAESFGTAFSSSTPAKLERMFNKTKFEVTGSETQKEAMGALIDALSKTAINADLMYDTEVCKQLSTVDYSNIDLSAITEFKPSVGSMYCIFLPDGKLPVRIVTSTPYYALAGYDGYELKRVAVKSDALQIRQDCPDALVLFNEVYNISITDTDTGNTTSIYIPEGIKLSEVFDTQLYTDADLTVPANMETVATRGGNISLFKPSAVSTEVGGDEAFKDAEYVFSSVNAKVTLEDGSSVKLLEDGDSTDTVMEITDTTTNAASVASTYIKYKNAVVYNIDLLLKGDTPEEDKKIVQLTNEVEITLPIPDGYINGQGFAVYNYHEGLDAEPTKVTHKLNSNGTFTIKTLQFSPFLVAYNDVVDDGTYDFFVKFEDNANAANQRPGTVQNTFTLNGVEYKKVNSPVNTTDEYQKISVPVPSQVGGVPATINMTYHTINGYTTTVTTHEGLPCVVYKYEQSGTDKVEYTINFDDEQNVAGKRPATLTVTFTSSTGDNKDMTLNLSPNTNTAYTQSFNVPKNSGTWTISSVGTVTGYEIKIEGLKATLTHKPEKMEKTIVIKWEKDGDNKDKTRPDKIAVVVSGGGKSFNLEVKESDSWTGKVSVYKYLNGQDASYTVTAPDQSNYSKVISGDIITYTFTGTLSKEAADKEESKDVGVTTNGSTKEEEKPDFSIDKFDWIDYANRYKDLFKVFGYDKELLYHHYIYNGMREGRFATFTGKYDSVSMDILEKYTPTSASDGKGDTTIDPNGNTMKEEINQMNGKPSTGDSTQSGGENATESTDSKLNGETISKIETDEEGNTIITTEDKEGNKTETKLDAEGNIISTQTYKTGDNRAASIIVWSGCGLAILAIIGFVVFGLNSASIESAISGKSGKSKKSK